MGSFVSALIFLAVAQTNVLSPEVQAPSIVNEQFWLETITQEFVATIGIYSPDKSYRVWACGEAGQMMALADPQDCPQLFVLVDRNPAVQLVFLGYYLGTGQVVEIGWDKASTGDPQLGKDYHYTPCGFFLNSTDNFSYRAAGTKNARGWRGYGKKGMRVWDFGWQMSARPIRGKLDPREIRLLMHATDPDLGEAKLGTIQSKGCVRISHSLNSLLDRYGVLDRQYIDALPAVKIMAILPKNGVRTGLEGKFLLVVDSSSVDLIKK